MKKLTFVMAGALGLVSTQAVFAQGLDALPYSGIQASFNQTSFDDIPEDGSGYDVTGSFAIGRSVFITAGFESTKVDFDVGGFAGSVTNSSLRAGLGYHYALTPTVDLVPQIALIDATASFDGDFAVIPDQDDTGWSAGISLRSLVTPNFELGGGMSYVNLYDDSGTSLGVQAHYYLARNFGVGIAYETSDGSNTLGMSASVLFGR